MILRPDKFHFCRASHLLVTSLMTLTDIRSWFGLVNQVASFLAVAPIMEPFRCQRNQMEILVYWDEHLGAIIPSAKETRTAGCRGVTLLRCIAPQSYTHRLQLPRYQIPHHAAVLPVHVSEIPSVLHRWMEAGIVWQLLRRITIRLKGKH